MVKLLFKPRALLFIGIYIGFVFWLLSGTKDEDLSDFPWGNIYLENTNGELSEIGAESYHFNSEEDSYISYENFDHFKEGFCFKYQDGVTPKKIRFTDFKYNKFFRTLTAVCDFRSHDNDYLNAYFDYYIYENNHGFSRASGYELDVDSYDDSLPFFFTNGAILTIKACSNNPLDDMPTDIFFRFEKDQYPNNEPSYETETIRLRSEMDTYKVVIPKSLTESGYSSVLMYIENINTSLIIKDIALNFEENGNAFTEKLIFSKSFGSAVLAEPFSDKDFKWEYKFKFSKDFSKIEDGYLEIHSEGYEPWKTNYGPNWFYLKSK